MGTAKTPALWLGRFPMVDPEHEKDLEQRAAIHEFGGKMPRHIAEQQAHDDYRHDQLVEAAAHHLVGLRAAHAAGATDHAVKHGAMYVMALRALGHDNTIDPPEEVHSKAKHTPAEVYRFRAHDGDAFSIRTHEGADEPLSKSEGLGMSPQRTVESRRYGQNGRVVSGPHAGKRNPYFRYDDYLPPAPEGGARRPTSLTIFQRGREAIAQLGGGHGEIRAFRRADGGYALSHDGLKHAHPITQQLRQHVVRALGDHLKLAHGAPYFLSGN